MNNMARGFTTLMITTVVLSLTLASALTIAQIGLVGAKDDKIRTNRLQAEHSAHACGEVALLAIRDSGSLSGSLSDDPVSCSYTVTDVGGGSYSITAVGNYNLVSRTVTLSASFDGSQVTISSWSLD